MVERRKLPPSAGMGRSRELADVARNAEQTQPGRLPGELDKAAFVFMLGLYEKWKDLRKGHGPGLEEHDAELELRGAVSLYSELTGAPELTVWAALAAAHDRQVGGAPVGPASDEGT